jgi:hypothetical protein
MADVLCVVAVMSAKGRASAIALLTIADLRCKKCPRLQSARIITVTMLVLGLSPENRAQDWQNDRKKVVGSA